MKFFLDFSVPTTLTMGDELTLPAIVYNYLPTAQAVEVSLDQAEGLTILGSARQTVNLGPSEVRSVTFRVRVDRAGEPTITLRGSAGEISDALVRSAEVRPSGTPEKQSYSDKLADTAQHSLTIPADAVEGGTEVVLNLTPGFAAQAVQGMEALIKEPNGCF